jgi:glycosyltransferase involved in cell wall biosynthesis
MWLAVLPTPYHKFLLQHLKRDQELAIEVYYSMKSWTGLPWKIQYADEDDNFFDRRAGVDWSLVAAAFRERDSFFLVAGWDDLTKLLILAIRGFRKLPFAIWTDTVKVETSIKYKIKRLILSNLLKNAAAILTTGEVGIASIKESGFVPKDIPIVNFPFWVPLPQCARERVLDPEGVIRFLCAGRLVPRKGYDLVIQAFRYCLDRGYKNIRLQLAGTGPEESNLQAQVEQYSLRDYVKFLGWLEADEMQAVRINNDVFIHCVPVHDPFPVAVLEAMASGLPVIGSSKAGSVVERVKSGVSGFVINPDSLEELVEAIIFFARQPNMALLMGRNARSTAEQWPVERGIDLIKSIAKI